MAFSLKTWVNRISEYPNRRKLTHEDGSTELVTVARSEGQISAEGNAFSAKEMNDLENRIKGGFDEVNQSLSELNEGIKDVDIHKVNSLVKTHLDGKTVSIEIDFKSVLQGLLSITGKLSSAGVYFTFICCVNSEWNDVKCLYMATTNGQCEFNNKTCIIVSDQNVGADIFEQLTVKQIK